MRGWKRYSRIVRALLAGVCSMAVTLPIGYAQSLSAFMQVKIDKSVRPTTGFVPANREQYLALNQPLRPRGPVPAKVDISDRFPVPGYQGQQMNCVAWAVGYAARSYYVAKDSGGDLLRAENVASPAFIYNTLNKRKGGSKDCKTSIAIQDAITLLQTDGAVPLAVMMYREDDCIAQALPAVLTAHAPRFRVQGYLRVDDESDIKGQISRGNPVIFAINLTKEFDTWDQTVFKDGASFKSTARDGRQHAMVITGYDDARKAYKFINSWSNEWGEGGFGWIDYQAAKALWIEGYVMTLGAKPAAVPAAAVTPPEQLAAAPSARTATTYTPTTITTTVTRTTD